MTIPHTPAEPESEHVHTWVVVFWEAVTAANSSGQYASYKASRVYCPGCKTYEEVR